MADIDSATYKAIHLRWMVGREVAEGKAWSKDDLAYLYELLDEICRDLGQEPKPLDRGDDA